MFHSKRSKSDIVIAADDEHRGQFIPVIDLITASAAFGCDAAAGVWQDDNAVDIDVDDNATTRCVTDSDKSLACDRRCELGYKSIYKNTTRNYTGLSVSLSDMIPNSNKSPDYETAEAYCSKHLVSMNTNSNGKVSSEIDLDNSQPIDIATASRGKVDAEDIVGGIDDQDNNNTPSKVKKSLPGIDASESSKSGPKNLRRVKTINMGEIPLRPVGLSLSGSGMELYVKVDNVLQKDQLADLQSQLAAQVCKIKKPTRKPKGKRKPTQKVAESETSPIDRPGSGIPAEPASDNLKLQNIYVTDTLKMKPGFVTKLAMENKSLEPQDSLTSDTKSNVEQKVPCETCPEANSFTDTMVIAVASTAGTDSAMGSLTATNSSSPRRDKQCLNNNTLRWSAGNSTDHSTTWRQPKPKMGKRSALSSRIGSQSIDTTKDWLRKKRPIFTSSDLPLKRPSVVMSSSSGDILLHQERNNSSLFSPVPMVRSGPSYAFCSTSNARAFTSANISTVSRQTKKHAAMSVDGDVKTRASSTYALADNDFPNSHPHQGPSLTSSTPIDPANCPVPPTIHNTVDVDMDNHDRRRAEDNITPLSFDDFDPSQVLASGTVDAATLARFAQYTSSMRRDLKHNYKKLSVLMKEFNEEVVDHYRDRQTVTSSADGGSNGESRSSGMNDGVESEQSGTGSSCTLM